MKSLVMYGDTFGAEKMVPATGQAHLVTSFGLSVTTALFDVMDELIAAGLHAEQPFTMDPGRWISKTSPAIFCSGSCSALCTASRRTTRGSCAAGTEERQGVHLHLLYGRGGQCTRPGPGAQLVGILRRGVRQLGAGARCNRNSAYMDIFGAILGRVPYFGC